MIVSIENFSIPFKISKGNNFHLPAEEGVDSPNKTPTYQFLVPSRKTIPTKSITFSRNRITSNWKCSLFISLQTQCITASTNFEKTLNISYVFEVIQCLHGHLASFSLLNFLFLIGPSWITTLCYSVSNKLWGRVQKVARMDSDKVFKY